MTEDDIFNRLKRSSFETVLAEINHGYEACLFTHPAYKPSHVIQKHGWTKPDYLNALCNSMKAARS